MSYEQQIWNAWYAGIGLAVVATLYFVLSHRSEDYGPTLLARMIAAFSGRYIMSRDRDSSGADGSSTGAWGGAADAGDLVRGQQHQVNDSFDDENALEREPLVLRQLPKTDLIVLLAVQRKDDGSYLWSANDITKFYPGADAPIKNIIATVRGKKTAEPAARSIRKGANGDWEPVV